MPTAAVSAVPRLPQRVAAVVYALAFRRPSSSWSPRCPAPAFSPFSLALQRLHRPSTSDRLFGFGTAAIRTRGTAPCAGPPFQSEALPTVLAAVDVSAEVHTPDTANADEDSGRSWDNVAPDGRVLKILGIETSCDDTAVAVINSRREILSERIHHQTTIHEPLGGIYPHAAAASHALELPALVRQALDDARLDLKDLDAVAVTRGPGISPCLAVGINVACALAAVARKPIVAVNHMEAHALTPRFSARKPPSFPFLALLISGGHTMIVLAEDVGQYKVLAASGDESVGEAFDKTARLLRIPWLHGVGGPAGAALELVAERGNPDAYLFPVPMSTNHGKRKMAFSYSGLRTEVERLLAKWNVDVTDPAVAPDVAASFQKAAATHLTQKLDLAFQACRDGDVPIRQLVVSGGVAANAYIRSRLNASAQRYSVETTYPPAKLCTDNGVMIAWAGLEKLLRGMTDRPGFVQLPTWQLDALNEGVDTTPELVVKQLMIKNAATAASHAAAASAS